jgi:ppGpp synthetase/RelA/SpoT-type nucleotidyltranferase
MNNLSPQGELLLSNFSALRPQLEKLSEEVYALLCNVLKEQGIELNAIEHRVKTEKSLVGKLERKGDKYHRLDDITDLVGLRIVTFYTDDVDKVAAIVKNLFDVDWQNSVDKRKLHQLTSFGYNSLHYICRLKEGQQSVACAKEVASIPFEIQMRTALQHAWSAIEHDIGYKGAVKLPPEFRRQFSRLAGMLELADDEFSRLRTTMNEYRRQVETLVQSGRLSDVPLSTDSFRSYLNLHPFERLNQRIAAVNQAEIYPASLMTFLPLLESFGMETLDDVQQFIDSNSDEAYQLALSQLAVTDLDILSESVGLLNLCFVYELRHNGGLDGLRHIYDTINGRHPSNEMLADFVLKQAQSLSLDQQR